MIRYILLVFKKLTLLQKYGVDIQYGHIGDKSSNEGARVSQATVFMISSLLKESSDGFDTVLVPMILTIINKVPNLFAFESFKENSSSKLHRPRKPDFDFDGIGVAKNIFFQSQNRND
jgi:hypothetical protein